MFFIKVLFYLGIVVGGAYLAVTHVPSLRANIIEYANPRIKEARLLTELQTSIDAAASATISSPAVRQAAATKAKSLVAQISELNDKNSGLVPTVVEKVIDVAKTVTPILPASVAQYLPDVLTSTPTPVASPCPAR
jgi:hypothetical protein